MYLSVLLNIGVQRPFKKEIIKNIELLRKDPEIIDERSANIAASALQVNGKKTIKRILIPVLSKPLIKKAKSKLEIIYQKNVIKSDIKSVVNDIVEFIERKEILDNLVYPNDPDFTLTAFSDNKKPLLKNNNKSKVERELRQLSAILVTESETNSNCLGESHCKKEYCLKGCVCASLDGNEYDLHCGKKKCMFKCSCKDKKNTQKHNEESMWHKTDMFRSNDVLIKGKTGKANRGKKIPVKFSDNVIIEKEMNCFDSSFILNTKSNKLSRKNSKSITYTTKKYSKGFKISKKKCDKKTKLKFIKGSKNSFDTYRQNYSKSNTMKNTNNTHISEKELFKPSIKEPLEDMINIRKEIPDDCEKNLIDVVCPTHWDPESWIEQELIDVSSDEMEMPNNEEHPFSDIFIWCTIHLDYNCQCNNYIFFGKTNNLYKGKQRHKNISTKKLSTIFSKAFNFSIHHLHNRYVHSARTGGIQFDLNLRNNSAGFVQKRKLELKYNILSNTNSLFKISKDKVRHRKDNRSKCNKNTINVVGLGRKKTIDNTGYHSFFKHIKQNKVSFDLKCHNKKDFDNNIEGNESSKFQKRFVIGLGNCGASPSLRTMQIDKKHPTLSNSIDTSITNTSSLLRVGFPQVNNSIQKSISEDVDCPQLGLLCLTDGIGYLPVKDFTPHAISVRHPTNDLYQKFRSVSTASAWLNKFCKSCMIFEDENINLEWVLVESYFLKDKKLFDKRLISYNRMVVNKEGNLMDKINCLRLNKEALPNRCNNQLASMDNSDLHTF